MGVAPTVGLVEIKLPARWWDDVVLGSTKPPTICDEAGPLSTAFKAFWTNGRGCLFLHTGKFDGLTKTHITNKPTYHQAHQRKQRPSRRLLWVLLHKTAHDAFSEEPRQHDSSGLCTHGLSCGGDRRIWVAEFKLEL